MASWWIRCPHCYASIRAPASRPFTSLCGPTNPSHAPRALERARVPSVAQRRNSRTAVRRGAPPLLRTPPSGAATFTPSCARTGKILSAGAALATPVAASAPPPWVAGAGGLGRRRGGRCAGAGDHLPHVDARGLGAERPGRCTHTRACELLRPRHDPAPTRRNSSGGVSGPCTGR